MLRVASTIAVISFLALPGCRSPRATWNLVSHGMSATTKEACVVNKTVRETKVRQAALIEEVEAVGGSDEPPEPRESLPPVAIDTQPDRALTLSDLEGIAISNHPALLAAAARIEAARGRQVQAGLYANPVIGYHATEIGNLGTAGQQGAFVSQRLITSGKRRLDRAISSAEADKAQLHFHAEKQRVLNDVRIRFHDALAAQRRVELTKELSRIGENLVEATETLVEGRLGTENDLLQAQIREDESHILYDNALNSRVETWRRLAAAIGMPAIQMNPLDGELEGDSPTFDWDECLAMLLESHPELNAARTQVDHARLAIERARIEPIPNVELSVSVRHHNVTTSDVANVQVGIPIPVFNRNQGNIRTAQANWISAREEVTRIELDLQDRLAVAFRRFSNSRKQVERYRRKIIPRANRSLELVTNGYQEGQVKYLTLLVAQQTYLQVNLSYLDSLRELRDSVALIEGQLLNGSLSAKP